MGRRCIAAARGRWAPMRSTRLRLPVGERRLRAAVSRRADPWVGPPPDAIAAMGDKAAARQRAAQPGVPVLPGYDGAAQDDATLLREARAHRVSRPRQAERRRRRQGHARRARRRAELAEAVAAPPRGAARVRRRRLILERYVDGPRHVEVQVLFDAHGHGCTSASATAAPAPPQKIIEESPAPSVDARAARAHGRAPRWRSPAASATSNAGTVEFLLADDGNFYFLEMNTRLQVEHPVTEAVTGRDLVADQLRIAAGRPARARQARLPAARGHAVEARLYAEDPDAGFLPATGRLLRLRWPDGRARRHRRARRATR